MCPYRLCNVDFRVKTHNLLLSIAHTYLVQVSLEKQVFDFAQILAVRQVSTYLAPMSSKITPDVRVDEGSHCNKTPNILSFLVPLCWYLCWTVVLCISRACRPSIRTGGLADKR